MKINKEIIKWGGLSVLVLVASYCWQQQVLHPAVSWSQWQERWQQSENLKARLAGQGGRVKTHPAALNLAHIMDQLTQAQLAQYLAELPTQGSQGTKQTVNLHFVNLPFDAWANWMQALVTQYPELKIEHLEIDRAQSLGCVNLRVRLVLV